MSLYETVAARLIATPLQRPAQWLQHVRQASERRRHPELAEFYREGERTDAFLRRVLRHDTHGIDIGCHIGSFLQKLTALAPDGRHHAVEPVARKAAWLRRKFPGTVVHEVALSDYDGEVAFFVNRSRSSYSGLRARESGTISEVRVACRRLDHLIPADARIGFIKIDVNGAELHVLKGALGLLARDRPAILLECTLGGLRDYGVRAEDVYDTVTRQAGYRIFLLKDWLADAGPLDLSRFRSSMEYPFQAFNYAVVPSTR
jgi:FkbM family methyltransferase